MIPYRAMDESNRYAHRTPTFRSSWAGLANQPFKPLLSQEARARKVLGEWILREKSLKDPEQKIELAQEAWEKCASEGLIPIEWIGSDRRWTHLEFSKDARNYDDSYTVTYTPEPRTLESPPSVRACLAMAANPAGVVAAEELAKFFLDALIPLIDPSQVPSVVWRIDGGGPENTEVLSVYTARQDPIEYLSFNLEGEKAFAASLGERAPQGWPLYIARMARSSALFDILIRTKVSRFSIDGQDIAPINDVNPLHRAAEIFAMGYGLERSRRIRQLRLVAMPLK